MSSMIYPEGLTTHYVGAEIEIKASAEEVWQVISEPGNLNHCHPFCKKNEVKKWGAIGAVDSIEYYNGLHLKRVFTQWSQGQGYELIIGKGKQASAKVLWEIIPTNEDLSILRINIHVLPSIALTQYPRIFRRVIGALYLMPRMQHYIKSVVKGFKYYIETGTAVKMNQFGYNKMFSIR